MNTARKVTTDIEPISTDLVLTGLIKESPECAKYCDVVWGLDREGHVITVWHNGDIAVEVSRPPLTRDGDTIGLWASELNRCWRAYTADANHGESTK
jgi:hypothetical protein